MTTLAIRSFLLRRTRKEDLVAAFDRILEGRALRDRRIFLGLALIAAGWFALQTASYLAEWDTDSPSYYTAAHGIRLGIDIYDDDAFQAAGQGLFGKANLVYPYIYPPLLAQILFPLARLPYPTYFTVLYVVNMALAFLTLYLLAVLLELGREPTFLPLLLPISLTIANEPLLTTIHHGQINLLVLDALLLSLILQKRGWTLAAGIFLSLAIFLKVYPAVFVLPLIVSRNRRALGAVAASSAGLLFLSVLISGPRPWVQFGRFTLALFLARPDSPFGRGFQDSMGNYSLKGSLAALGLPSGAASLIFFSAAFVLFFLVFASRRRTAIASDPALLGSFLLLLTNILAPISWSHHSVVALLPVAYLFRRIIRDRRYFALPVLAVLTVQVFYLAPWGAFPYNQTRLISAVGLFIMLYAFAKQPADDRLSLA
jgi:alpha-1,2-mannosyltransferase